MQGEPKPKDAGPITAKGRVLARAVLANTFREDYARVVSIDCAVEIAEAHAAAAIEAERLKSKASFATIEDQLLRLGVRTEQAERERDEARALYIETEERRSRDCTRLEAEIAASIRERDEARAQRDHWRRECTDIQERARIERESLAPRAGSTAEGETE